MTDVFDEIKDLINIEFPLLPRISTDNFSVIPEKYRGKQIKDWKPYPQPKWEGSSSWRG